MVKKGNVLDKLDLIVWANVRKWQMIRGVSDSMLCACLGIKTLNNRNASHFLTTCEIGRLCKLFEIEPEKLFER